MSTYSDNYGAVAVSGPFELGAALTPCRLFVWSGSPPVAALAGTGTDADGVTLPSYTTTNPATGLPLTNQNPLYGYLAHAGLPIRVEAGGSFSAGALLQSDSAGRAIAVTTGKPVLRALEAAIAGAIVWAVFTSGR